MATALRQPEPPDPAAREVEAYLVANARKPMLRFITCGSVDDGKSTLIGRLLYDSKMLFEDQLAALESDSRKAGAAGALDFASLVDGLAAEREQGITIDVAYRFFATAARKFVVADTPGHEQYTRNMVTGASTADAAIILIDARKGVLAQTRRHSHIAHLLGIRHLVLAVNKMDLVGYDQARFDAIVADYRAFATAAGIEDFTAIPVSGLQGDNVTMRSAAMAWYPGPSLLEQLEAIPVPAEGAGGDHGFRMPVQWVNRADQNFRGYAGTIAAGRIRPGDPVTILPSGRTTRVERILAFDGDLALAGAGQAVTLTFADDVDCSRGDLIATDPDGLELADHIEADLVWMAAEPLRPGRAYWLKLGALTVAASVARVAAVRDIETMAEAPGRPLGLNDIGRCALVLDRPIPAALYRESKRLGGFILIDRASHATLAAGMIAGFPDRPKASAGEAGQGRIVWLTGSSAEERARFARKARERFAARGRICFVLEDSTLRDGLSSDLGGSPADEAENRRRTLEAAKLLSRAGVTVLIALAAPGGGEHPGTELDVGGATEDWDWII